MPQIKNSGSPGYNKSRPQNGSFDIGKSTSSGIRLFADDCLFYRVNRGKADARELQKDLFQLCIWA